MNTDLAAKLKESVSVDNHYKVDEISKILDPSIEYKIVYTRNLANYRILLQEYKMDDSIVDKSAYVLSGKAVMFPRVIVEGPFVFVLLITSRQEFDRFNTDYSILIYEEENFLNRMTTRR